MSSKIADIGFKTSLCLLFATTTALAGFQIYGTVQKETTLKEDYSRAAACESKLDHGVNCTPQELASRVIVKKNEALRS